MGVSAGIAACVASMRASTVASMFGVGVGVSVGRALATAASTIAGKSVVGVGRGMKFSTSQAVNAKIATARSRMAELFISCLESLLFSKSGSKRGPR